MLLIRSDLDRHYAPRGFHCGGWWDSIGSITDLALCRESWEIFEDTVGPSMTEGALDVQLGLEYMAAARQLLGLALRKWREGFESGVEAAGAQGLPVHLRERVAQME